MIIKLWHKDETAQYAAEELKKYLEINLTEEQFNELFGE